MLNQHIAVILFFATLGGASAKADVYGCAKQVVADGWLKKYEYLGNTWGANTKKSGSSGSASGSTTENTTASVDPGVSTGKMQSSTQYSSSWGECSILEMNITQQMRENYIDQNVVELRKQIAQGSGHHLMSLAFLSGCNQLDSSLWSKTLQDQTSQFYEAQTGAQWSEILNKSISSEPELSSRCQPPQMG